jgi:hypothetical protein
MPVFCCRWPNGDISFVAARNRREAVIALDELGNAETSYIFTVAEFMLHLQLEDNGKLSFQSFGEVAHFEIMTEAYPLLEALVEFARPSTSQLRQAVREERRRLKGGEVEEPETQVGREIKKQLDAPTVLMNEIVREQAKKRLKNFKPRGKPQ